MKANEVRVGNLVFCTIREDIIEIGLSYLGHMITCEPIILTLEWLVKFGFKKSDEGFVKIKLKKKGTWLELNLITKRTLSINGFSFTDFVHVKYVHQLQNLYFALTGVELELSSNVA